jgi:hypothetical protein
MENLGQSIESFNMLVIDLLDAIYQVTDNEGVNQTKRTYSMISRVYPQSGLDHFIYHYYTYRHHFVDRNFEFFNNFNINSISDKNNIYEIDENSVSDGSTEQVGKILELWKILSRENQEIFLDYLEQIIVCADFYIQIKHGKTALDLCNEKGGK